MTSPATLFGQFGFALILFNLLGYFLGWAWWINTLAALSMFMPVVGALTMNVYQFAAVFHLVHLIFKW